MHNNQFYYHIFAKYPEVRYNGEDLNIEKMYASEVKKMWDNQEKYSSVVQIALKLNVDKKKIYRLANKYNFGNRR